MLLKKVIFVSLVTYSVLYSDIVKKVFQNFCEVDFIGLLLSDKRETRQLDNINEP